MSSIPPPYQPLENDPPSQSQEDYPSQMKEDYPPQSRESVPSQQPAQCSVHMDTATATVRILIQVALYQFMFVCRVCACVHACVRGMCIYVVLILPRFLLHTGDHGTIEECCGAIQVYG